VKQSLKVELVAFLQQQLSEAGGVISTVVKRRHRSSGGQWPRGWGGGWEPSTSLEGEKEVTSRKDPRAVLLVENIKPTLENTTGAWGKSDNFR